jgi:DNA-binding transcriptional ArsR family regulator
MSGEGPEGLVGLLDALDRTVHEPARLGILVLLQAIQTADFVYLLRETGLSRGNLSTHAGKLESAGLIEVEKTFVDKTPRTLYRISDQGLEALAGWRTAVLGVVAELDGDESR